MQKQKVVAVVVARMGSARVPGKSMIMVAGKPLLGQVLSIVRLIRGVDDIVFATSSLEQDQVLADLAVDMGIRVYRGHPEYVLDRVYSAALEADADVMFEIGGDCPFIDPEILGRALEEFLSRDLDYLNNYDPPTFPEGMDINILKMTAVRRAFEEAIVPSQRIHPFSYLTRHSDQFKIGNYTNAVDLCEYHWSLDFPEDINFIQTVYDRLYRNQDYISMNDILGLVESEPEIARLNKSIMKPKSLHAFWNSPGLIRDMHSDIEIMIKEAQRCQVAGEWEMASRYYQEIDPILVELKRLSEYRKGTSK